MTKAKRRICVVVTARPSYSRIKTALREIQSHPKLELQLVIAGSALLGRYGTAVRFIEDDGFTVTRRVFNVLEGGNLNAQAKTTGLGIIELTNVFDDLKPDAVVTIADRFETMSTAIAATYMNIPLVHVQGGEVTGNIDEKVRHAITKLADIHLVSTKTAAINVIRMGEKENTVFETGCPSIDLAKSIYNEKDKVFDIYNKYSGVGVKPDYSRGYIVVMQHPVTTEYDASRTQAKATLNAIRDLAKPTFWFWPNVDAGSDGTSNAIRSFREHNDCKNLHFFKNMEPNDFLRLLNHADCLIGNSSAGIREASYLGVPVVNIGSRQHGRERAENVLDVDYSIANIKSAINQQVQHGKYQSSNIYGNGGSGRQIANILATVELNYTKTLNY